MIIGSGLLAQAFAPLVRDDDDVLVFASGVSNSRETSPAAFARERELLERALELGRMTVYFSTCSVHDPELSDSLYVQHKRALEQLVRDRAPRSAILRLPQVVGTTPNPFTLTNYLHSHIRDGLPFQVWLHARRNLIDVADVAAIGMQLVRSHGDGDLTTNVACPFATGIIDLVHLFETLLDRRANYTSVDAGAGYALDTEVAMAAAAQVGINFDEHYVRHLIEKYYA